MATSASLYDPLGFATPITLVVKTLLQRLWQSKYDWDEQLPPNELWKWKEGLPALAQVMIPCCYTGGIQSATLSADERLVQEIQLHCFADASAKWLWSCVIHTVVYRDGTVMCVFWENLVLHLCAR